VRATRNSLKTTSVKDKQSVVDRIMKRFHKAGGLFASNVYDTRKLRRWLNEARQSE